MTASGVFQFLFFDRRDGELLRAVIHEAIVRYCVCPVCPLHQAWTRAIAFRKNALGFWSSNSTCGSSRRENPCLNQLSVLGAMTSGVCSASLLSHFHPTFIPLLSHFYPVLLPSGAVGCFFLFQVRSSARGLSLAAKSNSFQDHLRRKTN